MLSTNIDGGVVGARLDTVGEGISKVERVRGPPIVARPFAGVPDVTAHILKLLNNLRETFWLLPGFLVLIGVGLALALVDLDREGSRAAMADRWPLALQWRWNRRANASWRRSISRPLVSPARCFQSLLPHFPSPPAWGRGCCATSFATEATSSRSGRFLGRSRTRYGAAERAHRSEGQFVPHLALSVGILLAFVCVGTLVFFVGHMAGRINVDTVIELVSDDVRMRSSA